MPEPAAAEAGDAGRESSLIARTNTLLRLDDPAFLQRGLTEQEVLASRAKHGENKLPEDRPRPFVVYLLMEFLQPLILILLFLLALTIYRLVSAVQKNAELARSHKKTQPIDIDIIVKLFIIVLVVSLVTIFNARGNANQGRALGQLAKLAGAKTSRVRRGEREREIPAEEVVVGDVVLVRAGDTVQADMRVMETIDLACVEAALTGEPTERKKTLRSVDPSAPFLSSMLYSGTSVVCGSGLGVVTAVGPSTEIGRIAKQLDKVEPLETPVQRTMRQLGALLISIVVIMLVVFAIVIWKTEQYDATKYDNSTFVAIVFESLSLAQILLPTTLMLTVTVGLQRGVISLQRHKALLRRFTAVETLGCTTVICSDKTGTLTEGKMTAVRCATLAAAAGRGNRASAASFSFYPTRGYDPTGGLFAGQLMEEQAAAVDGVLRGAPLGPEASARLKQENVFNLGDPATAAAVNPLPRALVGAAFLNCSLDTRIEKEADGSFICVGNTSEAAVVVAGAKVGMWQAGNKLLGQPPVDVLAAYPAEKALEVPFTSGRKMKLTVHSAAGGELLGVPLPDGARHVALLKGAPDRVEPFGRRMVTDDLKGLVPLDDHARQCLAEANAGLADQGLRVLAVAFLPLGAGDLAQLRAGDDADARLQWFKGQGPALLGLLGLEDPPRHGVRDAVACCHSAGIKVVMITGDQAATAASISSKVGIVRPWEDKHALSHECAVLHTDPSDPAGSEQIPDVDVDRLTCETVIWARAQPVDKIAIVESLQRQGEVAAMTGDGVNDAAALKAADIGTAMGISGTEVAKASADMLLLDDNFTTIVDAVREGRHIYGNLQKYIYYYLGMKLCELVLFTCCVFFRLPKPVGGVRALLGKNITHDTAPITLALEEPEPYQMKVGPRRRSEFILTPLLVFKRLIPQLIWYNVILLGITCALSRQYFGTVSPKIYTEKVGAWKGKQRSCLRANQCDGTTDFKCKAQSHYFVCQTLAGNAWVWEYGSVGDISELRPSDLNEWTGELVGPKRDRHEAENPRRAWVPLSASQVEFNYTDAKSGATFPAVRACNPGGKSWEEVFHGSPDKKTQVCWTREAAGHFAAGKKDEDLYPHIAPTVNRADWCYRKLQATQFLSYVLLELAILYSCRTEGFFWEARRNDIFFVVAGAGLLVALLCIYVPGLNRGMDMTWPHFGDWCWALGGALTGLVCSEAFKVLYRTHLSAAQAAANSENMYISPGKQKKEP